jgi:pimeloyl-ACP methyl ester carboxylesterase
MKMVLIVVGVLAVGFLLMVVYLYVNQRKMLYFPQGLDRDWQHIKENSKHEIEFQRDETRLRGWLLYPERPELLIYYGGNGEEVSYNLAEFDQLKSHAILLVNYRGYGESEGRPTEADLVADALAIFDEMNDKYGSIVVLGRSLGSGIAVQVAANRQTKGVILVTPYDSIVAVGQAMYRWAPVSLLLKDPFDSIAASSTVTEPALFLIAEQDEVIPEIHSRKLADAWKSTFDWVTIKGSSHNSISSFPAYWVAIDSFLNSR